MLHQHLISYNIKQCLNKIIQHEIGFCFRETENRWLHDIIIIHN